MEKSIKKVLNKPFISFLNCGCPIIVGLLSLYLLLAISSILINFKFNFLKQFQKSVFLKYFSGFIKLLIVK